jgi:predicted aspartyl protease
MARTTHWVSTAYLIALTALLGGCQDGAPARVDVPADSLAGEVSFDLAGPGGAALIVPVHVNGEGPFDFVLDTGATFTCVSPHLSDSLGLETQTGQVGYGAGIGGSGQIQLVRADSVRLGAAQAHDMTVCVVQLDQLEATGISIDGLLGLNFLKEFRMSLDFERQVVRLY